MHGHVALAASAVIAAFVTLSLAAQDNWFVAAQAGLEPTAVGCSEPDVLGDSVCIAVDAGGDGPAPTVWLFGDTEALWDDAVAVSVDDGEVFVAVRERGAAAGMDGCRGGPADSSTEDRFNSVRHDGYR